MSRRLKLNLARFLVSLVALVVYGCSVCDDGKCPAFPTAAPRQ